MKLATLNPHGSDLGSTKTMAAEQTALANATEVGRTTCVFLVREVGGGMCTIWSEDGLRPSDRGPALELMGVNVDDPLRSRPYAMAYAGADGEIVVLGTSEAGKELLRTQFHNLLNI